MAVARLACLLLLAGALAHGQQISAGVKAGGRLTDDLEGYGQSESKRYAVGPTVEVRLPWRLSVGVDALYRAAGYRTYTGDILGSSFFTRARANSWEFPIFARYRLPLGIFVSGGWAVRTLQFSQHTQGVSRDYYGNQTPVDSRYTAERQVSHGVVAGGGIEFGGRHLRIAPEFRYTRWNNRPVENYGSHGYTLLSTQNQLEILLGLRWR